MLSEISGFEEIYIACGRSDLRKGIDGLATLVKEKFDLSPFQKNVLFLFCGSRQDRFKGLVWEGDGFVLLYKRIEAGRLTYMIVQIFPLHRLFLQAFLQHEIRLRYSAFPQPVFEQDMN